MLTLRLRHFEKAKDAAGCRATAELWEKMAPTHALGRGEGGGGAEGVETVKGGKRRGEALREEEGGEEGRREKKGGTLR